jgi:excinuclease ABC subunit B
MKFKLQSTYQPAGSQPEAIKNLVKGIKKDFKKQVLLGVTGSGKTFTIANVIEKIQKPTLVIAHNKTLAAQLCNEFREFFPDNAVHYFVSYYDYYQPEAYMPASDTYIEKEAMINSEIDRLRHACTQSLLTRKDVIIVASVSAIYGLGSPKEYERIILHLQVGKKLNRREMLGQLVEMQFQRNDLELKRGSFRLRGQIFDIMPINEEMIYRFEITDKIESISVIHPLTKKVIRMQEDVWFFPAKHYVIGESERAQAFVSIREELQSQLKKFIAEGKLLEVERLERKVKYDLEMIENVGYCNGIENYSRHFDGRKPGEPPFTLLDYFLYNNDDFLTVIDESHVTVSQIGGMYFGDKSRKDTLVNFGFRLPSARDNRPLKFEEFDARIKKVIYVSATPADYEIKQADQVVEQLVRPTGLVDPGVEIRPIVADQKKKILSQVEDVMLEIDKVIKNNERILITTLTKRMAEDLTDYLREKNIKVRYLHSDIETIERIEVITELRQGKIDVIVGVNLLREGLDIPEVSLVAILDADKEGFLRNETSLVQTIGRAARNVNGRVILYADTITKSIKNAIRETDRRRVIQLAYNKEHNITPKTIEKAIKNILEDFGLHKKENKKGKNKNKAREIMELDLLGDGRSIPEIIKDKEERMRLAVDKLEFELAALLRDEIRELRKRKK